jgi:hypothetical protein
MKKTGVITPAFFCASGSVLLDEVAGGIEVAGRVVSRVVQVLDVRGVSAERIGGGRTLGNGSVGVAVVVVVVLRSHSSTSDDESGRSGQNKKSHDMILRFLFLKVERRTLDDYTTLYSHDNAHFSEAS